MSIFVILLAMAGGAAISELYHQRMWVRYQQGKREGRCYNEQNPRYAGQSVENLSVFGRRKNG